MSSQSSTLIHLGFSGCNPPLLSPAKHSSSVPYLGVWTIRPREVQANLCTRLQCNAVSKPRTEEYKDVFQNSLPVIKWDKVVENDEEENLESLSSKIKQSVESIRSMLRSMNDGEITISAYDTAWVALVEDIHDNGGPQFPTSLKWIADNQLDDGSWGDSIFEAHDRLMNTLACVIALKSWNIHPNKFDKGMSFIKDNIRKLEDEKAEHMPIGFEVAFPSLIEMARKLEIEIPDDSPYLQEIYSRRNLKLTKIPKDILHAVPTTLLHSLEGMPGLDWEKLLKLQCQDGSFLFSPSSTAFALAQTKDDNCLRYLSRAVEKFNGGVPNVYPVDLFEHIWVVDRLERLGLSRYFKSELKESMDYVFRYWTEEGICWARNSPVHDIDDTAMGFRLLRLYGHQVSADVFRHFKKGGEFFCFAGQSNQAVTGMYNLYRASQVRFPGEKILEEGKKFASKFLWEKRASNELFDKWIITKDLPGEVGYVLDVPWYASLPRVETRFFLEQYGGEDDVWIGKTLYRMPYVNNNTYLELAILDYNQLQALHQQEWDSLKRWYAESNLGVFGVSQTSLLLSYYLAMASIFEPERSNERVAWAKTSILVEAIVSSFSEEDGTHGEQRKALGDAFRNGGSQLLSDNNGSFKFHRSNESSEGQGQKQSQALLKTLLKTLNQLSLDTLVAHGKDIHPHLSHAWGTWIKTWEESGDGYRGEVELLVRMINLSGGRLLSESNALYNRLFNLTSRVCNQLRDFQQQRKDDIKDGDKDYGSSTVEIDSDMQELVKSVFSNYSDGIEADIKQTFLAVARSYYYISHISPGTIHSHIAKVLFESA